MKAELTRKLLVTLVAPALGLSVASVSMAASDKAGAMDQAPAMNTQRSDASMTQASAQDVRASKIIGMKVKNAQGETLGKIDDLVVDVNNERVYYAVLASGGVLNLGGKLFAYPVSLFRPGADKDELALNVDKDRLKNAPGFERKNWPDWGNTQDRYRSDVEKYFGPTVMAKAMPNERLVRASTLIGKDVDDREGKKAGEIKDVVVNLGTGRVHYAVLDVDTSWMKADKLMPVSLHAFTYPADKESRKDLVLNVAKNQLDVSQGIEKKRWSDMDINDPNYKRNVDSYLTAMSSTMGRSGAAGPTGSRKAASDTESRSGKSDSDTSSGSRGY